MIRLYGLLFLVDLALLVIALIDCLSTDEFAVRNLPKVVWVFLILLFSPIGAIVWFVAGRPQKAAAGRAGVGVPATAFPSANTRAPSRRTTTRSSCATPTASRKMPGATTRSCSPSGRTTCGAARSSCGAATTGRTRPGDGRSLGAGPGPEVDAASVAWRRSRPAPRR